MNFVTYLNAILTANFRINYFLSQKKNPDLNKNLDFKKIKDRLFLYNYLLREIN